MGGWENLAWGAVGVFVGVIATALGNGVVGGFTDRRRRREWATSGVTARFVQASGANGCIHSQERTEALRDRGISGIDVYRVWLTLDLSSASSARLRELDLRYDWTREGVQPAQQDCVSDGQELARDAFNRLLDPPALSARDPLRLFVRRHFLSVEELGTNDEYRTFALRCEIATKKFGPQHFTISGKLEVGGEVSDVVVRLQAD